MRAHRFRVALLIASTLLLGACASMRSASNPNTTPENLAKMAQAEADAPDERKAYLEMIGQMQQQGAWFASLAHVDAFRQKYGNPPELRLLQAHALFQTGQVADAETAYRSVLGTPQAAAGWHGIGLIAAQQNRGTDAEQALAKAVQLDPLNAAFQSDLGFACLRNGHLDAARAPLAKAAELAPDDVKSVANLALWTLLDGDANKAEAMMLSANLPASTRNGVYQLARQLRTDHRTVLPAPSPASGNVQPPGSMLDRFTNPPLSTSSPANKAVP